jgi:hypothetical protein
MKKLLFITIALLATMSVNAQDSESLIYEKDWTGVKEFPYWFGSDEGTGATMEMVADGIAIHNPRCQNEVWTPQIVITDDCLNLEEGHNYLVRLTLKIPSNDLYGVQVGDFYTFDKDQINVKASDSWQVVDVEFLDYDGAVDGKNHVVLLAGYCVGTTIVKKVEVYELKDALPAGDGVVVYKQDWTGVTEFTNWFGKESTDATLEMVADGIAITNPEEQSQIWTPQTAVTDDCICLEDGHDYVVRLTLKIPSDGAYEVQLGIYGINIREKPVDVTASDSWQVIDVEFPNWYGGNMDIAHVVLQNGWVVGTTIVKRVEVIDLSVAGKCDKPEISYDNGKVSLKCATEGAVCHWNVTNIYPSGTGFDIQFNPTFVVTAYATKKNYAQSDVAKKEVVFTGAGQTSIRGDMDGNNVLNAADVVLLVDKVMGK